MKNKKMTPSEMAKERWKRTTKKQRKQFSKMMLEARKVKRLKELEILKHYAKRTN